MSEDTIELGGNIVLIGFSSLEKAKLIVLKKIIGNYARKISDKSRFDRLSLKMIQNEGGYGVFAELTSDNPNKSETADKNIFVAVDNSLKNLINNVF